MKQISFFPSTALGALLLMMPVPAVTPVVPNGGFEEQGDVLDGDGDMIPVAQDPGDLVETVPGWTAARGGIFNPARASLRGSRERRTREICSCVCPSLRCRC